jgi:adenine-specific DNA-methyltransferase
VTIDKNTCLIKFEYRPLTGEDLKQYSVKTKDGKPKKTGITQDELNTILKDKILDSITPLEPKIFLSEKKDEKTILERHLYKYTRKITSDFFIHKDLKGFLERELDYFIKTEVLDIDSLDTGVILTDTLPGLRWLKISGKELSNFYPRSKIFKRCSGRRKSLS